MVVFNFSVYLKIPKIIFWTTKLLKSIYEVSTLGKSLCVLRLSVVDYVSMVRIKIESLKQRRFASVFPALGLVRTHSITHYDDDDDDSNNNNNIISWACTATTTLVIIIYYVKRLPNTCVRSTLPGVRQNTII